MMPTRMKRQQDITRTQRKEVGVFACRVVGCVDMGTCGGRYNCLMTGLAQLGTLLRRH